MCNKAVHIDSWLLYDAPDYVKTQEMCNKAIEKALWLLFDVPDRFRSLRMSIRAIHPLIFITPCHPKVQGECERAVKKDPLQLNDVPDYCFGTHQDTGFGVFLKMKNKRQKTCGHKNGPFLCLVYRNIF